MLKIAFLLMNMGCLFPLFAQGLKVERDGVRITESNFQCHNSQVNMDLDFRGLVLENTTANLVKVSFKSMVFYDGHCVVCKDGGVEEQVVLMIEPFGKIAPDCKKSTTKKLRFLKSLKPHSDTKLTGLEIRDLVIEKVVK